MASTGKWIRKLKSSWDLRRVFNQLWVIKDVKGGKLVGTDQFGNKYYEDVDETWGRHRHVEYAVYDYNATHVPPHWRQWLQHTFHDPPAPGVDTTPVHQWNTIKHDENPTGSYQAYKPYSTTVPKIQSWEPKVKGRV